ncbi:MAG: hypothetical protein WCH78_02615 [Bacteroidota bacterium]
MKERLIHIKCIFNKIVCTLLTVTLFINILNAQDSVVAPIEKRAITMQLAFYKKADSTKIIIATVKGKSLTNKFLPLKSMKVNFYVQNKKDQSLLNSALTDATGKVTISVPKVLPLDDNLSFTIFGKVENDSVYQNAEEHVHFKDVNLSLLLLPKDSTQTVRATVTEIDKNGSIIPVKGKEIKFYVKRLFGMMPAGEDYSETTDETGVATFSYPKDIKGDEAGSIMLIGKIQDDELYGNIESRAVAPWGIVLAVDKNPFPRALWEPQAPFPLIITILVLFGIVWSFYFYIVYQLRQISKEGNPNLKQNHV